MTHELAYLAFGGVLCLALAAIAAHYYRRGGKERVEGPKWPTR